MIHIPAKWNNFSRVLIDSGAFDGTKTSACGEIDLKVLIGPCEFEISFVVVHIPVVFNVLLGRPWIHSVGAISSSLHQKVKFISGNRLITIIAEEDIHVLASAIVPFINAQQVDSASKYHSFKFVIVNYIPEGEALLEPKLSHTELMIGLYPWEGSIKRGQAWANTRQGSRVHPDKRPGFNFWSGLQANKKRFQAMIA